MLAALGRRLLQQLAGALLVVDLEVGAGQIQLGPHAAVIGIPHDELGKSVHAALQAVRRQALGSRMAALGAAWALGFDWSSIRAALASFVSDAATAPGRFNVFDYKGATLIADYGHNPDAISALVQAVEALPSKRRSVVISGAGDRRDEDIRQQTRILGTAFDEVVLYEDACQRGRVEGEVVALLRDAFLRVAPAMQMDGAG